MRERASSWPDEKCLKRRISVRANFIWQRPSTTTTTTTTTTRKEEEERDKECQIHCYIETTQTGCIHGLYVVVVVVVVAVIVVVVGDS